MDIYWYGQACFKVKGKNATVVIDPYYPDFVGLKAPKDLAGDIALATHEHKDHSNLVSVEGNPIQITGPGEYEIKGVSIVGTHSFHDIEKGAERGENTVYSIHMDGLNIVHLGDLGHVLTQDQINNIGQCDILMVPVGGVYTIDAKVASEVVSQLEPRIIIPMHYSIDSLKFQLDPLNNFLKEMGVELPQPQSKLSITKEKLPEETQVVVLSKV